TSITTTAGFTQTTYLSSLQTTASLYRALQANVTKLQQFNTKFKTFLPATGSPRTEDRIVLFSATSVANFNQTTFLNSLGTVTPTPTPTSAITTLTQALETTGDRAQDLNLLY